MVKSLIILIFMLFATIGVNAADKKEIILSEDNTLILDEAFNGQTTVSLMERATKMDSNLKSGYPMYLFLYTPGGHIQAGLELFEFLEGLNRPVHTVTLFAASMGFQTVQHLGDRYILKYGVLMSHKARGTFSGEFGGNLSQLDSRYGLWVRRVALMDQQTVDRTKGKQTLKSYTAAYNPELWLNGQEAVDQGYADSVVTVRCDATLGGSYDIVEDYGWIKLTITFSKCPIKTYPLDIKVGIATNKGFMELNKFIEKNGRFDTSCQNNTEEPTAIDQNDQYNYYSYIYGQSLADEPNNEVKKEEVLCVQDKSLTLENIQKKKEERAKWHNRSLKDHIVYSY